MKPLILVSAPTDFIPEFENRISDEYNWFDAYGLSERETCEIIREKQPSAWLCSPCPTYLIGQNQMHGSQIRIVATPSTGINHIDLDYLDASNISVWSLLGSDVVKDIRASSEFTVSLLLAMLRKIPQAQKVALSGQWRNNEEILRAREFSEIHLGIMGFGRIGQNLCRYALALGFKCSIFDPYTKSTIDNVTQFDEVSSMLPNVDVLAVCMTLNDETTGMINKSIFELLPNGSLFLNTSRGEVVDEGDLLDALASGRLAGAAVDVVSNEKNQPNITHPMLNYASNNNNLIVTPHIAGLSKDSEAKAQLSALEAIQNFLKNFD